MLNIKAETVKCRDPFYKTKYSEHVYTCAERQSAAWRRNFISTHIEHLRLRIAEVLHFSLYTEGYNTSNLKIYKSYLDFNGESDLVNNRAFHCHFRGFILDTSAEC